MPVSPDAEPDRSLSRSQLLLAARGGAAGELADAAGELAHELAAEAPAGARVIVLSQVADDPFPAQQPLCRPYEVVVEVEAPVEDLLAVSSGLDGVGDRLDGLVHADLSAVLVGHPQHLMAVAPTPVRYLYLMRRKAGTTHEQYIDYYLHRHSRFGFKTPGILGYTQFHVDPAASQDAAGRAGVGIYMVDSVSELHMTSLADFFAALGGPPSPASGNGLPAEDDDTDFAADEELFVDRANSVMFTTLTRLHLDPRP